MFENQVDFNYQKNSIGRRAGKFKKKRRKKRSFNFLTLIIFFLILAVSIGVALIIINRGGSGSGTEIILTGGDEVYRGVPFDLTAEVFNDFETSLKDAVLSLNLPQGVVYLGSLTNSSAIINESIGDISGGGLSRRSFKLLAVDELGSSKKINFTLSYKLEGKALFEVTESKEIIIKKPAVELNVIMPEMIIIGSPFVLAVNYKNISDFDFPNINLEANFPPAFKFISADLPPDALNNWWRLGELKANSRGVLEIKGVLENMTDSKPNFGVSLKADFFGRDYVIVQKKTDINLSPSPLAVGISLNRKDDYVAKIGERLNYAISYKNNSNTVLNDVVIKAVLTGELLDWATIESNGEIDSVTNTIFWRPADLASEQARYGGGLPELKLIEPNSGGEINFSIKLKNSFPISRLSDKNFFVRLNIQAESPSVIISGSEKTSAVASLTSKIAGLVSVEAKVFYRDAQSGILNSGYLPPKVGVATEYTIHWIIRNYAADISKVKIRTSLEDGVVWTGVVKSNIDSSPIYSETTDEIVWEIDKILATKGVIGEPIKAIFQVRAEPQNNQVGDFQPLIGKTIVTAIDDFTGLELMNAAKELNTSFINDQTVSQEEGRVVQ